MIEHQDVNLGAVVELSLHIEKCKTHVYDYIATDHYLTPKLSVRSLKDHVNFCMAFNPPMSTFLVTKSDWSLTACLLTCGKVQNSSLIFI